VRKIAVQRFDKVEFKATKTPEGFVQDDVIVGRSGLLKYMNADGSTRYEYRPDEEAFDADSLSTIRGKPITIGHPGLVLSNNVSKVKPIGTVLSEGRQDGNNIRADVVIYNLDTKNRELSCGYTVDLDETPGVFDGVEYAAVQRNVKYNHLAVVKVGRAGKEARLNMDNMDQIYEEEKEIEQMEKLKLDNGLAYDASPEVIVAYNQLKQDAENLKKEVVAKTDKEKAMQAELDAKDAKCDTQKAQIDKHAEELAKVKKDAADEIKSAVAARVELLKVAKTHKVEKADSLTDKEIKIAVIKKSRNDEALDLTAKSDEYINAAFDFTKDTQRNDALEQQRKIVNQKLPANQRADEEETSISAQQKMINNMQNAYKGAK